MGSRFISDVCVGAREVFDEASVVDKLSEVTLLVKEEGGVSGCILVRPAGASFISRHRACSCAT